MDNILLQVGPFPVYTLGLFLAISYLIGIFSFWRLGRREGFSSDSILDLTFLTSFFGLLGGRLLFLFLLREGWGAADILRFGEGVFWVGVLLAGAVFLLIFSRVKGWSVLRVGALAVTSLTLGQAWGFLGAEIANYFPYAFYPAFGYLLLWFLLRFLLNRKVEPGYPVSLYLIFSGALLYLTEWLRPLKALLPNGWNLNYLSGEVLAGLGGLLLLFMVARLTLIKVKS
ncbi:MAG: prolipoprotein diacylglyceryl transferase family protein [Patescibacteria group bacterium]